MTANFQNRFTQAQAYPLRFTRMVRANNTWNEAATYWGYWESATEVHIRNTPALDTLDRLVYQGTTYGIASIVSAWDELIVTLKGSISE